MLLGLTICAILLGYICFKMTRRKFLMHAKKIPGHDPLPLLGNANVLMNATTLIEAWGSIMKQTRPFYDLGIMRFWFGPLLCVFLWEPPYIEVVANSPLAANKGFIYKLFFGEITNGVFTNAGGKVWKELRKPFTKSLINKYLDNIYFEVFVRRSREFRDFIMDNRLGKTTDIKGDVAALTLDIFAETHLGIDLNEVQTESRWNFSHMIGDYCDYTLASIIKYYVYIWKIVVKFTSTGGKIKQNDQKVVSFLKTVFHERQNGKFYERENGPEYYIDFLSKRAKEKNIRTKDLYKELTDVITAGADTTAVSLSSTLLFMAMFPEVQEEVYREQEAIFGDSGRDPTLEDLAAMDCLMRVIKETLRNVCQPGIMKTASGDLQLGKYTIPNGSLIYVSIYQLHHNPKYWEKPNSFHPDHFLPEQEAARPKYAFVPFGVGPRMCPGFQYGEKSSLVILSTILRNFKLSTKMKFEEIVYNYNIFLSSRDGYPVSFEKR